MGNRGNCIDVKGLIRDKCPMKVNFTSARNEVYILMDNGIPSRRAMQEACEKLDDYLGIAMDAFDSLSEWYLNAKEYEEEKKL